ncbi:unnamed protein product [Soboliphyme baturini]|uniref:Serine palmitoyltransferase 1 n=1 Tax=Soboliphyme baturini TaxID=241478 RepID=A0A183I8Y2_9BILA|nr:unnamed protein product [Soboliphyme baturini]
MIFESCDPFRIALYHIIGEVPWYHLVLEIFLLVWIVGLLFRKSYRPSDVAELTEKEKEELIAEWCPEPLVPDVDTQNPKLHPFYIEGKVGKFVTINGQQYLNFASLNFLGFIGNQKIEDRAIQALHKYGVGSCGPRGFYGTMDVHLELEKRIAQFLNCEESVLYSYGFPTIASVIPAYAKRGDVIFCDKGVNFAILKGLQASRSRVEFFEHNDMRDLERLLELQAEKDRQNPKKAKVTRRFLVVEGIYVNYGTMCPLPRLIEMKWKYKLRLFIDESVSFGVVGARGRGVTDYFGVNVSATIVLKSLLCDHIVGSSG